MNKLTQLLPLAFLFLVQGALGQDFSSVDEHARSLPRSKASSVEKLAQHLCSPFSSETQKVRAIYVWMAENIRYSTATVTSRSLTVEQRLKRQEPERVLQRKNAVCEGYANLFEALCEEAGLHSLVVTGRTKLPNGRVAPVGHAWNMVRADGQWHLLDVTWGAGGVDGRNGKYVKSLSDEFFLSDPVAFVQHHLPHDPLFQLLPEAVGFQTFEKSSTVPVASGTLDPEVFAQIDHHYELDKAERLLATSRRTIAFNPENGFANFTLSKHHYELALASYQQFFEDSQQAFDRKLPLTTAMVSTWEQHLADYRTNLKTSEDYLANIRSFCGVLERMKATEEDGGEEN